MLMVPAGFLLVHFSPEACSALRRSLMFPGADNMRKLVNCLTLMLQASPSLNMIENYPKLLESAWVALVV